MQFVRADELKPGMRLAKPIYNRTGVLLYERNTKLTVQGISSIQNFGLIGIFILEPAEPVPPLTEEELEFEQFQTIYMFQLRDNMDQLQKNQIPSTLSALADDIQTEFYPEPAQLLGLCIQTLHQRRDPLRHDRQ